MIKGIMAIDEIGGISKGQSMPWPKNSIDLRWFKENTLNNVVIMGRKTYDSLNSKLPKRDNYIISSKKVHNIKKMGLS